MRIRRATLRQHGEARTAVANGHVKNDVRLARLGEILDPQTRVPEPPYRVYKHKLNISTVLMSLQDLWTGCSSNSEPVWERVRREFVAAHGGHPATRGAITEL